MAKAIQLLDDDLLSRLDIRALTWSGAPSEEYNLKILINKLISWPPAAQLQFSAGGGTFPAATTASYNQVHHGTSKHQMLHQNCRVAGACCIVQG